jgi:hypothetical protein
MKPVLRACALLLSILCALALAQPTPQQIQDHQMAEERALQRDQQEREQQQHDAQVEKMREVDRQQTEDARQQAEKARAQAITAQENLYLLQQEEKAKAAVKAKADAADRDAPRPAIQSGAQSVQSAPQTQASQAQPAANPHWSFSNMSTLDKTGLAALGVILVGLAYAAGIIPAKRIPSSRNPR